MYSSFNKKIWFNLQKQKYCPGWILSDSNKNLLLSLGLFYFINKANNFTNHWIVNWMTASLQHKISQSINGSRSFDTVCFRNTVRSQTCMIEHGPEWFWACTKEVYYSYRKVASWVGCAGSGGSLPITWRKSYSDMNDSQEFEAGMATLIAHLENNHHLHGQTV